eukprot:2829065-Pyramimonas_sp.AAC.1
MACCRGQADGSVAELRGRGLVVLQGQALRAAGGAGHAENSTVPCQASAGAGQVLQCEDQEAGSPAPYSSWIT